MEIKKKYPEFKGIEEISNFLRIQHKIRSKCKLVLLISVFNDQKAIISEFEKFFTVKPLDSRLVKIKKQDKQLYEHPFIGYLYFPKNHSSSVIFISITPTKIINSFFYTHFLNKNPNINILWINHKLTIDLWNYLRKKFEVLFNFIKGDYSPCSETKANVRPDYDRVITYKGNDVIFSFLELQENYGIDLEEFEGRFKGKTFNFKRRDAMFSFKNGELDFFIEIADWLLSKSEKYMQEIREFRKIEYRTKVLNRTYKISNNLEILFEDEIPVDVFRIMMEELGKLENIEIMKSIQESNKQQFDIEVVNREKNSIYKIFLNQKSAHFTQMFDNNFVGIFPLLDILDYTQPKNKISIVS